MRASRRARRAKPFREARDKVVKGVHDGGVLGGVAEGAFGDSVFLGRCLEGRGNSRHGVGSLCQPSALLLRRPQYIPAEEVLPLFGGEVAAAELVADDEWEAAGRRLAATLPCCAPTKGDVTGEREWPRFQAGCDAERGCTGDGTQTESPVQG